MSMYHFYAEIYYNGNKADGLYKYGSGVVDTIREPHETGWYDEIRENIAREIGASSTNPKRVIVMSLTKI